MNDPISNPYKTINTVEMNNFRARSYNKLAKELNKQTTNIESLTEVASSSKSNTLSSLNMRSASASMLSKALSILGVRKEKNQ